MTEAPRSRLTGSSYVLFSVAVAACAAAVAVVVSGGFSVRLLGVRISSHGALRPALFALLFAAMAYRWMPQWQRTGIATRVVRGLHVLTPWTAPTAAATVLALCFAFGTRAAGGSDVYGYVSQARLWLAGDLHVHQDFVTSVPWPNADWTFTPLGYRPAARHTIVPTYAPGLPLLMAGFLKAGGSCGPFVVTPVAAAVLVLLTAILGAHVSGRVTGAIAAILVASSPTILMMSLWPMSDVPAAMFWIASLLFACRPQSFRWVALAGISAGIAIMIRPNLVPLALVPAALVGWLGSRNIGARPLRSLAGFAAACLPFILLVGWVNHDLYGSVLLSGYGDTSTIYKWRNLRPNLARYPRWLWETQGAYVFLFLLSAIVPSGPRPESQRLRRVLLAYIAGVFLCYLFYDPFEDWWYLRFVAAAMPAMFVLAVDAVWHGVSRYGSMVRVVVTILFTMLSVNHAIGSARTHSIFEIGEGEQKYADVGRYLAREMPPNTVVLASQHSGSIRYYSNLRTMRFDSLDGAWLDRAIRHLKSTGPNPYIVLEGWEIADFRRRFATQHDVSLLDRGPIAAHSRGVYVYGSDDQLRIDAPRTIPHTSGCE